MTFRSEKMFQAAVNDAATKFGWLHYHTHRSQHSAAGFPDLIAIKGDRLLVAELKMPGKEPTQAQRIWFDHFRGVTDDVYLWHPDDWDSDRIADILAGPV